MIIRLKTLLITGNKVTPRQLLNPSYIPLKMTMSPCFHSLAMFLTPMSYCTLNWSDFEHITELDLITDFEPSVLLYFTYYQISRGFHRTLRKIRLANRGRLLLRTPGPVPFGTCICCNVETILSWTCHVYGPFEFRTSRVTSILLLIVWMLLLPCLTSITLGLPGLHLLLSHFSFSSGLILLHLCANYLYLCLLFLLHILFILLWWDQLGHLCSVSH